MKKLMLFLALTGLVAAGCGDDQKTQSGTVVDSPGSTTTSLDGSSGPVWLLNPGS